MTLRRYYKIASGHMPADLDLYPEDPRYRTLEQALVPYQELIRDDPDQHYAIYQVDPIIATLPIEQRDGRP